MLLPLTFIHYVLLALKGQNNLLYCNAIFDGITSSKFITQFSAPDVFPFQLPCLLWHHLLQESLINKKNNRSQIAVMSWLVTPYQVTIRKLQGINHPLKLKRSINKPKWLYPFIYRPPLHPSALRWCNWNSPHRWMRKGRQRSGGRTSMQRFFSWFRGSRAMLQSSTRSVGVTMLRVWKVGEGLYAVRQMQRDEAQTWWRHQYDNTNSSVPLTMPPLMQRGCKLGDRYIAHSLWWIKERWQMCYWLTRERGHHPSCAMFAFEVLRWLKPHVSV